MNKIVFALALVAVVAFAEEIAVSTKLIREVNTKQKMWQATHNHITRMPKSQARRLLGVDIENLQLGWNNKTYTASEIAAAPETFDAREQWPKCTTMKDIRNQKHCGSCWAFGAVEAMSDRWCVHKNEVVRLSAEDMNSCARSTFTSCGSCHGGQPGCAWSYWVSTGVVSEDCYPYSAGTDPSSLVTPECKKKCTGNPSLEWASDKRKGSKSYTVVGEENMKTELATNGPFEVAFTVYEDFMSYKSGIYKHVSGSYEGGHAVKLVGYGIENGVKYWLCANSWDTTWGEAGYFRIQRGTNECGIERQAWAGLP